MKRTTLTLLGVAAALIGAGLTLPEAAARHARSTEANKALVRRAMDELWNQGNVAAVDKYAAADFVEHQAVPGMPPGREGLKQVVTLFHQAFPDLKFTIDDTIAEGDKVVVRSTVQGTHKGTYLGIPATNKPFTITSIDILRLQGGKVVEHWGNEDDLGMLTQLGVVTPPAPPAPAAP